MVLHENVKQQPTIVSIQKGKILHLGHNTRTKLCILEQIIV